jgi:integrase/recombinase XerD
MIRKLALPYSLRAISLKLWRNPCCNSIGHSVSTEAAMPGRFDATTTLYVQSGERKYLNAAERRRFIKAARRAPADVRLFCLVLTWSGGRISEVLALTPRAIDLDTGAINLVTLKRRKHGLVRQVLLPPALLRDLNRTLELRRRQRNCDLAIEPLWTWSRTTAWRRVKEIMTSADVAAAAAMPKGLRHSFGVNAFQYGIPPHLVQRWLGHASLETTAIYGDVVGPDEYAFAERMWPK